MIVPTIVFSLIGVLAIANTVVSLIQRNTRERHHRGQPTRRRRSSLLDAASSGIDYDYGHTHHGFFDTSDFGGGDHGGGGFDGGCDGGGCD
ncbi:hypothetical protein [Blastopirellula marina]|uniref:hypothetical protein n=1 Tax=Blastopirellula marina TaxID=124 RepID=UPI0018EB4192|nr:hypothetical protein [Blastopirellula marina]